MNEAKIRTLISRFSQERHSQLAWNASMQYWLSSSEEALIAYVPVKNVWVATTPAVSLDSMPFALAEFRHAAKRAKVHPVFFGVSSRHLKYFDQDHSLSMGSEPLWKPAAWHRNSLRKRSLRQQIRRAQNKGVEIDQNQELALTTKKQMNDLLQVWLQNKKLPALSFLITPRRGHYLSQRLIYRAYLRGDLMAYLVASAYSHSGGGYMVEQIIRHPKAVNGVTELLFHTLMKKAAEENKNEVSFGLAPLMRRSSCDSLFWRSFFQTVRMLTSPLYNFSGLYHFKNKLSPQDWNEQYLVVPSNLSKLVAVYAIAKAFMPSLIKKKSLMSNELLDFVKQGA